MGAQNDQLKIQSSYILTFFEEYLHRELIRYHIVSCGYLGALLNIIRLAARVNALVNHTILILDTGKLGNDG